MIGLVFLASALADPADAGFPDLSAGWLHAPGGLTRGPAGAARADHGLWMAAGQGLLYGLPDLPQRYLALGVRGRAWSQSWNLRLSLQKSGRGPLGDTWTGGELSCGHFRGLGLAFARRSLLVGGLPGATDRNLVLRGFIRGGGGSSPWFRLDAYLRVWVGSEVAAPVADHQRLLDLQLGEGRNSLFVRLARDRRDIPRLDCELLWGEAAPVALTLRFESGTGAVGPGIRLGRPGMLLMTSHLVHPVLGVTHRLMVVLGRWEVCRL